MADYSGVAETLDIPINRAAMSDPMLLPSYMVEVIRKITEAYANLAAAINAGPEFSQSPSLPTPANGRFMVWQDEVGQMWLLYADGGKTYRVQMEEVHV